MTSLGVKIPFLPSFALLKSNRTLVSYSPHITHSILLNTIRARIFHACHTERSFFTCNRTQYRRVRTIALKTFNGVLFNMHTSVEPLEIRKNINGTVDHRYR